MVAELGVLNTNPHRTYWSTSHSRTLWLHLVAQHPLRGTYTLLSRTTKVPCMWSDTRKALRSMSSRVGRIGQFDYGIRTWGRR